MFSIRMRASRTSGLYELHISGAEGIYEDSEGAKIVKQYADRALRHPRGRPDKIIITVEKIRQRPRMIRTLPVTTLKCGSHKEAGKIIKKVLPATGVSALAVKNALKVLNNTNAIRGAAVIRDESGGRLDPDKERGIRVSRLGISKAAARVLSLQLSKEDIDNITVREAIILASKVASCRQVTAELCISDDPDYTTGYISSKKFGYVRIPNIKKGGDKRGGRVFFIKEAAHLEDIIKYLEKTPVIINGIAGRQETGLINETLNHCHL